MPIYTYTCTSCNDVVEKRQSFSDAPLTTCEQCGGSLRKMIHPVGIVFKGSGWYITDSRKSSNGVSAPSKSESKPASETKSDSTSSTSTSSTSTSTNSSSSTSTSTAAE